MNENQYVNRRANAKLGLILFAIYSALYGGFVVINALSADTMETTVAAGLNLAIVYGFALILIALLMALIYGVACRPDDVVVEQVVESDSADRNGDEA